ncbi:MAG: hypothetical protein VB110_08475 [Bacteroidales bacterium]|nr:hypothetical protein [Bacteroidales bacterium]
MNNILNRIVSFAIYGLMFTALSSCEKNDFFDENAITGNVGPQAYWTVGSATVSAGSNMPFVIQYYSTVADIDHSEVWYNITEIQEKTVSCPWVTTFTYSINSTTSEEKRIAQKIQEYPHTLTMWSDSLHAYTFTGVFPVSGTLKPFAWTKPEVFDSTKMNAYFGTGYMQHFKDSLYTLMKYADFKNMLLGMSLLENFSQYTDSTFDINSNGYVYHFPKDKDGNTPVPENIRNLYNAIPFDRLIESPSGYNVDFKRSYFLKARMRVYDSKSIYGTTESKRIDIN